MKSVNLLSRLAIVTLLASAAGLALNALALALFATAACTGVILIVVADYARGPGYGAPVATAVAAPSTEVMPLAA